MDRETYELVKELVDKFIEADNPDAADRMCLRDFVEFVGNNCELEE